MRDALEDSVASLWRPLSASGLRDSSGRGTGRRAVYRTARYNLTEGGRTDEGTPPRGNADPTLRLPLERFVGRYIDSIETLEILLLLFRAPDTYWTPTAVDSQLGLKNGIADERLRRLLDHSLIVKGMSGGYRYSPANQDQKDNVSALAEAYAESRRVLLNAVSSQNLLRLKTFADAFKVRKE